ncbi:hypothetical protein U9M48_021239 [Paspalum notatum var. saurae]|uniref:Uncharacterized protein n=1 Tax=Paspalum notatum var. saurae TaxID=547442 RepID=A0AAQ3SVI8_PASNO
MELFTQHLRPRAMQWAFLMTITNGSNAYKKGQLGFWNTTETAVHNHTGTLRSDRPKKDYGTRPGRRSQKTFSTGKEGSYTSQNYS